MKNGMTIQGQNHLSIVGKVSKRGERGFQFNANSSPDSSNVLISDIIVDHCPQLEFHFFHS
jgi:hypothetical protein